MYIANSYFESRFNKVFKKGDVVPAEIAEHYLSKVTKDGDKELLVETPIEVEVEVLDEETLDEETLDEETLDEETLDEETED